MHFHHNCIAWICITSWRLWWQSHLSSNLDKTHDIWIPRQATQWVESVEFNCPHDTGYDDKLVKIVVISKTSSWSSYMKQCTRPKTRLQIAGAIRWMSSYIPNILRTLQASSWQDRWIQISVWYKIFFCLIFPLSTSTCTCNWSLLLSK